MIITTRSSIRVKPFSLLSRLRNVFSISLLLHGGWWWLVEHRWPMTATIAQGRVIDRGRRNVLRKHGGRGFPRPPAIPLLGEDYGQVPPMTIWADGPFFAAVWFCEAASTQ